MRGGSVRMAVSICFNFIDSKCPIGRLLTALKNRTIRGYEAEDVTTMGYTTLRGPATPCNAGIGNTV